MKENNNTNEQNELAFLTGPLPDGEWRERTRLCIHGINFTIDGCVYVTDFLKESLEESARRNIGTPILVSARHGELSYVPASPEEIAGIPPEHRLKTVVNGIETELAAVTEDDTPIPTLTQEHVENAKKLYWLRDAYVNWAERVYPKMAGSHQIVIMYG